MIQRFARWTGASTRRPAVSIGGLAIALALLCGCGQTEVRGTYEVELEIVRAAASLPGTLVLSTAMLDVPAGTDDFAGGDEDWLGTASGDANSCFIVRGESPDDALPRSVRLFGSRIQGREVALPLEIFRTPRLRIEIVALQFFAGAIGGDIVLYEPDGERPGRLHGTRVGPPNGQRCLEDLEMFRASLRAAPPT